MRPHDGENKKTVSEVFDQFLQVNTESSTM